MVLIGRPDGRTETLHCASFGCLDGQELLRFPYTLPLLLGFFPLLKSIRESIFATLRNQYNLNEV
jgi:hypothetical protein